MSMWIRAEPAGRGVRTTRRMSRTGTGAAAFSVVAAVVPDVLARAESGAEKDRPS